MKYESHNHIKVKVKLLAYAKLKFKHKIYPTAGNKRFECTVETEMADDNSDLMMLWFNDKFGSTHVVTSDEL